MQLTCLTKPPVTFLTTYKVDLREVIAQQVASALPVVISRWHPDVFFYLFCLYYLAIIPSTYHISWSCHSLSFLYQVAELLTRLKTGVWGCALFQDKPGAMCVFSLVDMCQSSIAICLILSIAFVPYLLFKALMWLSGLALPYDIFFLSFRINFGDCGSGCFNRPMKPGRRCLLLSLVLGKPHELSGVVCDRIAQYWTKDSVIDHLRSASLQLEAHSSSVSLSEKVSTVRHLVANWDVSWKECYCRQLPTHLLSFFVLLSCVSFSSAVYATFLLLCCCCCLKCRFCALNQVAYF